MIAFNFYENCAAQRALGQALALPAVLALGALAFKLQPVGYTSIGPHGSAKPLDPRFVLPISYRARPRIKANSAVQPLTSSSGI
jgi:hypothetical protein